MPGHLLQSAIATVVLTGMLATPAVRASDCPAFGDAHSESVRALNVLKNRATAPGQDNTDPGASLAAILLPGDDHDRWDESKGAEIVGYVVDVKPGGIETVNCHANDLAHRDTHIEIALTPDAPKTARMIVEVTPIWRERMAAQGLDWSTHRLEEALTGRRVVIRGWLMFDRMHSDESENTAPNGEHDWRATAWEIHPITDIEILSTTALKTNPPG